jgi:hypothetical protein
MTMITSNQLAEPNSPLCPDLKAAHLSVDRAELRALLIEGAISPKTTRLDNNFIEMLRR